MASNNPTEDELAPETTEGFKVGEKKTIDEYQQLGKKNFVCINPARMLCLHYTQPETFVTGSQHASRPETTFHIIPPSTRTLFCA